MNFLTLLLGVFVLSYAGLALVIWRRPLVGRIALRDILLTVGLVYAAVVFVTFAPALRAARLRPAEALRGVG